MIGSTNSSSAGVTSLMPSTAESTEMAGVIMASPKNSEAAAMPMTKTTAASLVSVLWPSTLWARAISESVPPSPRLSARSSSSTYLIVTTRISAQMISDSTAITTSRLAPAWAEPASTASRKA